MSLSNVLKYMRLYEIGQMMVPGFVGLLFYYGLEGLTYFHSWQYLVTLFFHLLAVYVYNDFCDYDLDQNNPRKKTLFYFRKGALRNASLILGVVSTLLIVTLPVSVRMAFLIVHFLCLLYSVPGIRLKSYPPFPQFIHFTAALMYFLMGAFVFNVSLNGPVVACGIFFGLLYLSGGLNNELMDHEYDQKEGVRTLADHISLLNGFKILLALQLTALCILCFVTHKQIHFIGMSGLVVYVGLMLCRYRNFNPSIMDQKYFLSFMKFYRLFFSAFTIALILALVKDDLIFLGAMSLYELNPQKILNRFDEDSVYQSGLSVSMIIVEHCKVIWTAFLFTGLPALLAVFVGLRRAINYVLIGVIGLAVVIVLSTLLFSVQQFCILLIPCVSSYYLVARFMPNERLVEGVNAWALFLVCQIVMVVQVLSLCNVLNAQYFLLGSLVILVLSLIRGGSVVEQWRRDRERLQQIWANVTELISRNSWLAVIMYAVLLSMLWRMLLIVYVPPNNVDSMTYHLSRIAHWLQNESMAHFYTHNLKQVYFPFNAEIMMMWTMLASKMDYLCGFIQFACYALSGTLVYRCMKSYLKIQTLPSLMVSMIWYTLPLIVLESTNTKNNLVVAYFVMFSLVYFLMGLTHKLRYLWLSAMALGVAVGTKTTALFYLLPFSVMAVYALFRHKDVFQRLIKWGGLTLIAIVLLGSYSYIQNFIEFNGSIFPRDNSGAVLYPNFSVGHTGSIFAQHVFNLVTNQTGLQFYIAIFSEYYNEAMASVGHTLFDLLSIPTNTIQSVESLYNFHAGDMFHFDNWLHKFKIHEDFAFFGFMGFVLTVCAAIVIIKRIVAVVQKSNPLESKYFIFAFLFFGYLITLSAVKTWDPWASRYMIVMVLVAMPLLGVLYERKHALVNVFNKSLVIYCALMLVPLTLMNQLKPLVPYKLNEGQLRFKTGETGGWVPLTYNRDRIGLRTLVAPYEESFFRQIDRNVPLDSKVGVVLAFDQWDYPIFGQRLSRKVVPVSIDILKAQAFDYVIASEIQLEKYLLLKEQLLKDYRIVKRPYLKEGFLGWVFAGDNMYLYEPKNGSIKK